MTSSPHPARPTTDRGRWSLGLFLALVTGFCALSLWLHEHGHTAVFDTLRWAKVLSTVGADAFRLEDVGLLYPHAPIYLLGFFRMFPGIADPRLPLFLSALCMAACFTLWNTHLRNKKYPLGARVILVLLVATHPFVLWSGSAGFHNAITFLMFYLFCYGCYLVVTLQDVRSLVFVSMSLCVFFFTDERTLFVLLALLPLIPLLAPRRMFNASVSSVYGVLVFPVALAIASWFYMNWIFHGDASLFLSAPEASFRGAWRAASSSPWLMHYGGSFLMPLLIPSLIAVLAFPLPIWMLWRFRDRDNFRRAMIVLYLHPLLAISLATAAFYLAHPMEILFLLAAVSMSLLLVVPRMDRYLPLVFGLLASGNLAAWALMAGEEHVDVRNWRNSLLARPLSEGQGVEQRLGEWLNDNRQPTLIDDRAGFRVIVARGDAKGLILPHQREFKGALRQRDWAAEQVVVVRPSDELAPLDAITRFAPSLYWNGMPGYRLVFDANPWRVYRRQANPVAPPA
jgi:membrane protein XagC